MCLRCRVTTDSLRASQRPPYRRKRLASITFRSNMLAPFVFSFTFERSVCRNLCLWNANKQKAVCIVVPCFVRTTTVAKFDPALANRTNERWRYCHQCVCRYCYLLFVLLIRRLRNKTRYLLFRVAFCFRLSRCRAEIWVACNRLTPFATLPPAVRPLRE